MFRTCKHTQVLRVQQWYDCRDSVCEKKKKIWINKKKNIKKIKEEEEERDCNTPSPIAEILCVKKKEKKKIWINEKEEREKKKEKKKKKKRETATLRPHQCRDAQLTDELEKQTRACVSHTEEVLFLGGKSCRHKASNNTYMVKTHQIKISLNVFNILTRPNNLESFGRHFPPVQPVRIIRMMKSFLVHFSYFRRNLFSSSNNTHTHTRVQRPPPFHTHTHIHKQPPWYTHIWMYWTERTRWCAYTWML